jgi:hypothetical protein
MGSLTSVKASSVGDELGNGLRRNRRSNLHDKGNPANARHRRGVAKKTETEIIVERRVDGIRRHREQQRVAVRGRAHHSFRADIAAGTRPVVDDELLAQPLRQPLTQHACHDVRRAAGRNLNDQAHWPRRIGLRPSGTRERRGHGDAHCPMQELAAGKLHGVPFPNCSRRGHATRGRAEHGRRDAHEPSISAFQSTCLPTTSALPLKARTSACPPAALQ